MKINKELIFPLSIVFLEIVTYLATDAYLPALPHIAESLATNEYLTQQTITAWFLGGVFIQPFLGPITDRFGRKTVLIIGGCLFITSTIFCANATNILEFIFYRFLQGFTVASTITGGYAAIHESFNSKKAIQILATMGSISILAPAVGPSIGAVVLHYTNNWRYIFITLTTLGIIGVVLNYFYMPETLKKPLKIDFKQTLTNYKNILKNKAWLNYAAMSSCLIFGFFVWLITSPFLLIKSYQLTEIEFGVAQAIIFTGFILGMQLCKHLINSIKAKEAISIFITINILSSTALLLTSLISKPPSWLLIGLMTLIAFGASGANTPLGRLAFEASNEPSGQKVAMFALVFTSAATAASFTGAHINSLLIQPFATTSLFGYLIAFLLFFQSRGKMKLQDS